MGWVNPTGFVDPGNWHDETQAYNDNTDDAAVCYVEKGKWGDFLDLTRPAINCTKVRFNARFVQFWIEKIDLDVYYDGAWHDVYEGWGDHQQWVEKDLDGPHIVTQARVRFFNVNIYNTDWARVYEFDFWEVPTLGRSLGLIMG